MLMRLYHRNDSLWPDPKIYGDIGTGTEKNWSIFIGQEEEDDNLIEQEEMIGRKDHHHHHHLHWPSTEDYNHRSQSLYQSACGKPSTAEDSSQSLDKSGNSGFIASSIQDVIRLNSSPDRDSSLHGIKRHFAANSFQSHSHLGRHCNSWPGLDNRKSHSDADFKVSSFRLACLLKWKLLLLPHYPGTTRMSGMRMNGTDEDICLGRIIITRMHWMDVDDAGCKDKLQK